MPECVRVCVCVWGGFDSIFDMRYSTCAPIIMLLPKSNNILLFPVLGVIVCDFGYFSVPFFPECVCVCVLCWFFRSLRLSLLVVSVPRWSVRQYNRTTVVDGFFLVFGLLCGNGL